MKAEKKAAPATGPAVETETAIREMAARALEALGMPTDVFLLALDHKGYVMRDAEGREVVDVRLPALLWDYPLRNQCLLLETAQAKTPVPMPQFSPWETCDAMFWCDRHGVDFVLRAGERTLRFGR